MAPDLIDNHVDPVQLKRAVGALIKHVTSKAVESEVTEMLGAREEFVWLVVSSKTMPKQSKAKPHRIPLSHPLVDPRTTPVCLITKDPQRKYKDLLADKNIKFISRVVGLEKLKGKFKPFEARRQLLRENGLFLADDRIIPLLPQLLGKMFFDAKKQPIPVCITKPDIKSELERAVSSTYMHQNLGTCVSIKIATSTQSEKHVLENIITALPEIVSHIPDGWSNIQSLNIKTSQSVSLPIWTCESRFDTPSATEVAEESTTAVEGSSKRRKRDVAPADDELERTKRLKPTTSPNTPSSPSTTKPSTTKFKSKKSAPTETTPAAPEPKPSPKAKKTEVPTTSAASGAQSKKQTLDAKKAKVTSTKGRASGRGVKAKVLGH